MMLFVYCRSKTALVALVVSFLFSSSIVAQQTPQTGDALSIEDQFFSLLLEDDFAVARGTIANIRENWDTSYTPLLLEIYGYVRTRGVQSELTELFTDKTGQSARDGVNDWYFWLWNQEPNFSSGYADFKAGIYRNIDARFDTYFRGRQDTALIRLDEIRWGGVMQDGIPPLRNPQMINIDQATYLNDDNIVFGIEINGDARAYPKRILAWHEMFTDTIGGEPIAGVYCTLCGTVIPYKTRVGDTDYALGTSGFLYRSNKLMYDKATQSLWSTTRGEPVVGPLAGKGVQLEYASVVTTTWGDWKKRHPDTSVLSLDTGHHRDYGEGVAYSDYFSNDRLMFNTPFQDDRLDNKREILALRFSAAPKQQLAIDTEFLNKNPVYKNSIGQQKFVVLTDSVGANRVYDPGDYDMISYDGEYQVTDSNGDHWRVEEESLNAEDGRQLARLPYHRAFWFGWHAAYPETKLVK